jgi:hypothetical protein
MFLRAAAAAALLAALLALWAGARDHAAAREAVERLLGPRASEAVGGAVHSMARAVRWLSSSSSSAASDRVWRQEELQADTRLLLSLLGHVFDVAGGEEFYGPGEHYRGFVGRDASRAFVTGEGPCTPRARVVRRAAHAKWQGTLRRAG